MIDLRKLHPWLYEDMDVLEAEGLIMRIRHDHIETNEAIRLSEQKLESVNGNPMTDDQLDLFYVTQKGKQLL